MPTVGSVKAQITGAANALRTLVDATEESLSIPPSNITTGDIQAFPEFWELFATAVNNNTSVPTISKLLYLKGKLKGEAAKLIAPLNFSERNYEEAVKILIYTYARSELLRARLYDQIEAVPSGNDTPLGQRTTLCTIKALWIQLQKAGEQPASSGLMRIIRRKFPITTRRDAHKLRKRTDDWTVDELLTALDQVIDGKEGSHGRSRFAGVLSPIYLLSTTPSFTFSKN
ncbi:unnamed protein product [Heligmosomoides polygyrus]|uniref:Uncharacterized protein n=1 Tax=Heligmosomoides polygyrus TaxID=6339 RepID=A0A183F9U4_HELPZ|nr:unnamed protein product [Heligmosomoides polygyrus]